MKFQPTIIKICNNPHVAQSITGAVALYAGIVTVCTGFSNYFDTTIQDGFDRLEDTSNKNTERLENTYNKNTEKIIKSNEELNENLRKFIEVQEKRNKLLEKSLENAEIKAKLDQLNNSNSNSTSTVARAIPLVDGILRIGTTIYYFFRPPAGSNPNNGPSNQPSNPFDETSGTPSGYRSSGDDNFTTPLSGSAKRYRDSHKGSQSE